MGWLRRLIRVFRPAAWSENRDPLGPAGEKAAIQFLKSRGYRILAVNARVPMGEADVVCESPDRLTVVLVEVKARRLDAERVDPPAEAAVTAAKRRKLVKILRHLARANRWYDRQLRIDVVGVDFRGEAPVEVRHHPGAVGMPPRR
jgi:putative endonuclease